MQNGNIQDSIALVNEFLVDARSQAQKEAALKTAAEDSSVSFKDTKPANPEEQAKQAPPATSQNNLGTEQTQAAVDSASNVNSVSSNSEADGDRFPDTQGTQTLTTDDPVKGKGNIGPTRTQEITQEQKTARAQRMGASILEVLHKEASAAAPGQAGGSAQPAAQQAAPAPATPAAALPNDADGLPAGGDKTAAQAAQFSPFEKQAAEQAAYAAQEYFEGFYKGLIKRAYDEREVAQSNIPAQYLDMVGGVSGLLDKVAMEFPEAVLPEGEELPDGGGLEALGGAPEGAPEMGLEGGGDPADELAAALEEAGVTPEELAEAIEDVSALQEAGIEPEQLAGAMEEIVGGGVEGGEAPAPEVPPAPEEGAEKLASAQFSPSAQNVLAILNRNR